MREDQEKPASGWLVRVPHDTDRRQWAEMYRGYADFYRVEQSEADRERVWCWIGDPKHEVNALLAQRSDGRVVGLAHYRLSGRPTVGFRPWCATRNRD